MKFHQDHSEWSGLDGCGMRAPHYPHTCTAQLRLAQVGHHSTVYGH